MNGTLAMLLLLVYGVSLAALGIVVSRWVRSAEDFFVAGRKLGPWLLAATVLAANIGAGSTVGVTGLAYRVGLSAWWWIGSAALGTAVLAIWVGPRIWQEAVARRCYTVGDYLESRYSSQVRGVVMGILLLGMPAILATQLIGIGEILRAAGGISLELGILLGGAVVLVYFGAGGLWSASLVNVVELAVKLVAFPVALLFAVTLAGGGATVARGAAQAAGQDYLSPVGIGGIAIVGYLGVLGPSFVVSPGLVQKAFGARSASVVRRGLLASAVALVVFGAFPTGLGIVARSRWSGLDPDSVLPTLLVEMLPAWLGLLTLAAVVSAELSSADAVLFMLSTALSRDLYQGYLSPDLDDAGLLRAGRVATAAGMAAALAVALLYDDIIGVLTAFYGIMTVTLAVPLLGGLYTRRPGSRSALAAVAVSLLVSAVTMALRGGPSPTDFWPYLLGAACGAVAFAVCAPRRG